MKLQQPIPVPPPTNRWISLTAVIYRSVNSFNRCRTFWSVESGPSLCLFLLLTWKKENKKFPVHFSFRKERRRRRRLMIISELTSSITKTFQTLASFVSDQTFLFLALHLDHNTQARTIFPQSLGSGGGLEVECSQMKTEGPGSIPIPGVDFFKSSHRFSA